MSKYSEKDANIGKTRKIKLSIIIVNYNGKHFLENCLNSIEQYVHCQHEVILVDNASTDGSAEYIRESLNGINFIESSENLGFSGGNNLGVSHAKGEYILLLNNDTIINSPIDSAVNLLGKDLSVGVLGIKMLGRDGEYRLSCGHFVSPLRLAFFSLLYMKKGPFRDGCFSCEDNSHTITVDWVEGSFILTRHSLWDELDGLDEGYFMYVEDMDYCRSVVDKGYVVKYLPSLTYIHYGGYSAGRMDWLINGFRRYLKKHFSPSEAFMGNLILTIGLFGRLIVSYLGSFFEISKKEKVRMYIRILMNK